MDLPIIHPSKKKYKRTPNCVCIVCKKPLYRRPFELAKVRHVACMEHRAEAQKISGITDSQKLALTLGREKGTNHLGGIPKSEESKRKRSKAMKSWIENNPEKSKARGAKTRAENHYNWKGGSSNLNQAIRRMTEYRKWANAVKEKDGQCQHCGCIENLESHHKRPMSELIDVYGIKNTDDARENTELWDIDNGVTLCQRCHYCSHDRVAPENNISRKYHRKQVKIRRSMIGDQNPNWKGGGITKACPYCNLLFNVKPSEEDERKYCSRKCVNDSRRKSV